MNDFHARARAGAADQYGRKHMARYARQARIRSSIKWVALAVLLIWMAFTAGVHWQ